MTATKKKKNENDFLLKTDLREKKIIFHDIVFVVNLVVKKLESVFLNNSLNNIICNNMERKYNKQKSIERRLIHISS